MMKILNRIIILINYKQFIKAIKFNKIDNSNNNNNKMLIIKHKIIHIQFLIISGWVVTHLVS